METSGFDLSNEQRETEKYNGWGFLKVVSQLSGISPKEAGVVGYGLFCRECHNLGDACGKCEKYNGMKKIKSEN